MSDERVWVEPSAAVVVTNTLSVEKTVDCDCTDATDDEVYTYVGVDGVDEEEDEDDLDEEARKKIGQLRTRIR